MSFKPKVSRAERSNAIDAYVTGTVGKDMSLSQWESYYDKVVLPQCHHTCCSLSHLMD